MVFRRPRIFSTGIWNARRMRPLTITVLLLPALDGCAMRGRQTPLEQLLGAPASAERHQQLAETYERKAADARAQASRHMSIAASYRDQAAAATVAEAALHHSIVLHCEALMRDFEDEAASYEGMAANHRALAEAQQRGSPRENREEHHETGY